ncbi:MAG: response regulator [Treponema sp.]|jgi:ABC-type glycerol-3-phosphate transport system permease component|nr:response regulator [Treponema sp.]
MMVAGAASNGKEAITITEKERPDIILMDALMPEMGGIEAVIMMNHKRFFIYLLLALIAFTMLIPFVWMLSASLKVNKDVFTFPIKWIPENPQWQN